MNQSTRRLHRAAIEQGKIETVQFREALRAMNPALGFIHEISHKEFIARRNKNCSAFYKFRHTQKPLAKSEIKNLFKS